MWNIYNSKNVPIAEFDSFIDINVKKEAEITKYPTEKGGFSSVNKVVKSRIIKVKLGRGGTDAEIAELMEILDNYCGSTDKLSVVTPYKTYSNLNLTDFDYSQSRSEGVGVLYADLTFEEVREVETRYTTVKVGNTQTTPLSSGEVKNASDASSVERGKISALAAGAKYFGISKPGENS